jgi:hypothetical protein
MQPETAEIGGRTGGVSARALRRRTQHRTVETLDKRTAASRRAMTLMKQFEAELDGNLTDGMRLAVSRAAVMTAIAEDARLRKLAGAKDVSLDDLVRLDRVAALAVKALGIGVRKPEPAASSLGALLAEDRRSGGADAPVESFADVAARAQAEASKRRAIELAADAGEGPPELGSVREPGVPENAPATVSAPGDGNDEDDA